MYTADFENQSAHHLVAWSDPLSGRTIGNSVQRSNHSMIYSGEGWWKRMHTRAKITAAPNRRRDRVWQSWPGSTDRAFAHSQGCNRVEFILPQVVGVDRLHGSPMAPRKGAAHLTFHFKQPRASLRISQSFTEPGFLSTLGHSLQAFWFGPYFERPDSTNPASFSPHKS